MDFLGLRNLDVIEITLDLIERVHRRPPRHRPRRRSTTRRRSSCCARADTIGVFQLEGGPMRALLRSLAPDDVRGRRRARRAVPARARWRRTGTTSTPTARTAASRSTYSHPDLEEILAPTYGLMIYQEQLMRVAQRLAGYSLEEADNLRKATGKKIRELIAKERSKFVDGCVAQRPRPRSSASRCFDTIEPFADYSFNKSHTRRLRLHRVPDRVAEGELPGRSTSPRCSRASRPTRTRPRSSSTSAGSSTSRCSSPTSTRRRATSRASSRRRRRAGRDPVRALGGAQRRRGRRRG